MTLIIDFGAPQKTSNTVEMFPLAGDIAKVSYFKINDNSGDVMTRSCLGYGVVLYVIEFSPGILPYAAYMGVCCPTEYKF